jgi:hypothetical protein
MAVAIRFDFAADKVILQYQNTFICGRNIADGVTPPHEILHKFKNQLGVESGVGARVGWSGTI